MIRFVEKPHLPQGEVRQIIIGEKYKNMLENALFEQNISQFGSKIMILSMSVFPDIATLWQRTLEETGWLYSQALLTIAN